MHAIPGCELQFIPNMKKLFLSLLLAVTALSAFADFRWGATAGFNYEKYHFKQKLMLYFFMVGKLTIFMKLFKKYGNFSYLLLRIRKVAFV